MESDLTFDQLARISGFDRDTITALDEALVGGGGGDVDLDTITSVGTNNTTYINQPGGTEDTRINGGKTASIVYIGSAGTGGIRIGTPTNHTDFYGKLHINGLQLVVFGLTQGYDTIFNHSTDNTGDVTINGGKAGALITIGRLNTGTVMLGGSGTGGEAVNPVSVRGNFTAGDGIASTATHELKGQTTIGVNTIFNYLGDASHDTYIRPGANGAKIRIGPDTASDIFIGGTANVRFFGPLGFYGAAAIAKQTGVAVTAGGIHAALVNLGLIAA